MKIERPLVSVYIPTRSRPALLERALASVRQQAYTNLDIVVCVDGPDPETERLLQSVAQVDARVRFVLQPQAGGACAARNRAIQEARGELITGLDDDDEFQTHHVASLMEAFEPLEHSLVCSAPVLVRPEGRQVRHAFSGPVSLEALLSQNLIGNQILTETARLREIGGFDESFPAWQDYECWVRLVAAYGPALKIDSRSYWVHLDHAGERITARERIVQAHERFLAKHGHLLTSQERQSLELSMLATSHQRFGVRELLRFSASGLGRRALGAFVSDRSPVLQRWARRIAGWRSAGFSGKA